MKAVISLVVLVLTIVSIVSLAIISKNSTPPFRPTPTNQNVFIQGIISDIASDKSSITLSTPSGREVVVNLNSQSQIAEKDGASIQYTSLHRGFGLQVTGVQGTDTSVIAKNIIVTSEPNIIVYTPEPNTNVTNDFIVSGIGRVFENIASIRITNTRTGKVLHEGTLQVKSPDTGLYGPFSDHVTLLQSTLQKGDRLEIKVFQASPKDGSEIDVDSRIVVYDTIKHLTLKIYLTNDTLNSGSECEKVFPVSRDITATQAVAKAALEQLLEGPTDAETLQGYGTALNDNVTLRSVIIKNSTAYADFTDNLQKNVGGSCRVTAIRSQITQTLKQFPSVQNVIISVDGQNETTLQP